MDDISPFDIHVIVCNIFKHIDDYKTFCSFAQVNSVTRRCSLFKEVKTIMSGKKNVITADVKLMPIKLNKLEWFTKPRKGDHIIAFIPDVSMEKSFHQGLITKVQYPLYKSRVVHFVSGNSQLQETSLEYFGIIQKATYRKLFVVEYDKETEQQATVVKKAIMQRFHEPELKNEYEKSENFVFICKMGEINDLFVNKFLDEHKPICA